MVKVLTKSDFISRLREIVRVSENKSYSDNLKDKMFENFVEKYAPEEVEMFEIQDVNTGEYIVKKEEGYKLLPLVSVSKEQFEHMEDEDKYFSGRELQFINIGSYKTTSVGKW